MTTKTTPKTKKCGRCGKVRPIENFSLYAGSKDGRNAWDRGCLAEYSAEKKEWHQLLDAAGIEKADRRLLALALAAGLTEPIAKPKRTRAKAARSTTKAGA